MKFKMSKIGGLFKSLFAKNHASNIGEVIQTDAMIVPLNEDESNENTQNDQNQAISLTSSDIPRSNSITPLKEHRLVELSTQQNNQVGVNGVQQQFPQPVQEYNQSNLNQLNISNSSGIHIGNVTKIEFNNTNVNNDNHVHPIMRNATNPSPNNQHRKYTTKTKTISEMMSSSDMLKESTLRLLATHLEDWKDVARELKYSDGQIQNFYLDNYMHGMEEVNYQMLLDWNRSSDEATVGTLTQALWTRNNYTAVYYLKKEYKKNRNENSSRQS